MTVAVVTGASGALGQAVVSALCERGDHVIAVDRSVDLMESVDSRGHRQAADLTDPAGVDDVFARVLSDHPQIHAVIHTVGMFRGGAIVDSEPADFGTVMEVNLGTAWWVSRAAARHMESVGGGSIVHVGARNGVEPVAGAAAYGVSKAAVVHLIRVLDAELRSHGVRVNAVLPGLIDTAANRAALSPEVMSRAVSTDAIAKVIAFLTGPDAAPVTGAIIPVYGASHV